VRAFPSGLKSSEGGGSNVNGHHAHEHLGSACDGLEMKDRDSAEVAVMPFPALIARANKSAWKSVCFACRILQKEDVRSHQV
jgi:hypothetical protein